MIYSFTLTLSGVDEVSDDLADALYGGGCDDALFGQQNGEVFLEFDREAPSLQEAIVSAIEDACAASDKIKVTSVKAEPVKRPRPAAKRAELFNLKDVNTMLRVFNKAPTMVRRLASVG